MLAHNVSRPREFALKAKQLFSAKIKFIRENRVEATQNQQFLVTAVTCWLFSIVQLHIIFQIHLPLLYLLP